MVLPELALSVTEAGTEVNDSVPCSTSSVMVLRLVSASPTDSSLLPVKSMAVLTAVLTEVDVVALIVTPLNWLIGASLLPVTVIVRVVVAVAPLVSLTS